VMGSRCNPVFFYVAFQFLLALFILGAAVAKLAYYGSDGYWEHFTNWAWTLLAVFLFSTVFVVRSCVRCAAGAAFFLFFPLNTIAWFVATTVAVLLLRDPEFITDLFEEIEPGLVIVGNDVFHVLPVFVLGAWAFLQSNLLWFALHRWVAPVARAKAGPGRCCGMFFIVLYQTIGGGLIFGALYLLVLEAAYGKTPGDVYGTDLSLVAGLGLFVAVGAVFTGIPLLFLACAYSVFGDSLPDAELERRAYEPTWHPVAGVPAKASAETRTTVRLKFH